MSATALLRVQSRLSVGGDLIPTITAGGVDRLTEVLWFRPAVPTGIAKPAAYPYIEIAECAFSIRREIQGFHIRVQERRALHARGIDDRTDRIRLPPPTLRITLRDKDIQTRFFFVFNGIIGGKEQHTTIGCNLRVCLPVA